MTKGEEAGSARLPVDPRAADPEVAAREEAERYGLPFEVALENVRASIGKRSAAVSRIRAISEEGAARSRGGSARGSGLARRYHGPAAEAAGICRQPRASACSSACCIASRVSRDTLSDNAVPFSVSVRR